ncbi:flavin carrier protein 1 [Trichomonascus vanleenenianus]|uniref:putative flavin adenine dinucleotide transporter n=1 Tax=Trichomonascus vanleenenianus TaxID=2268995 RepID=UPI003EC9B2B0
MDNSLFSSSQFDVVFTPANRSVSYDVSANVEISGYVTADIEVVAYGFTILTETIDPCKIGLKQLCPFNPGQIDIKSHSELSASIVDRIPGVAYTVPDLDAIVYVKVKDDNGNMVACIQADLTNTKSVAHTAVKWVTAVISGIGLLTSAVLATYGNSYAAAHIATNALLLFGYFQATVIITMEAVERVPPMAAAWTQNIAWSMGLIEVPFMQSIFRWYVQATGGSPTTYIKYPTIAVLIQKRDVIASYIPPRVRDFLTFHGSNMYSALVQRSQMIAAESSSTLLVLRGIKRVGFQAGIEQTAIVLTGFTFFVFICVVMGLCYTILRGIIALLLKTKVINPERWEYYRANWRPMLKGTILRMVYIGFPQLMVLSLWEFIQRDSAAVIVLAVFFFLLPVCILGWNSFKVFMIGKRSMAQYQTPAYLLYSDSQVMNKYGFLYIQFAAQHYYFIVPGLVYIFVKACFISFAQSSGKTQGLALFIIELGYLVLVSWKRPYMDKSTNIINIVIQVILTINAFFFLFFSNLFGQPAAVASIMGVLFFIINAAFSLVLLISAIVTCVLVLVSKNPDSRYKPAKDDRASFIQEQHVHPDDAGEFTALGIAARADHAAEDADSQMASSSILEKNQSYYSGQNSIANESITNSPLIIEQEHNRSDSYTGLNDESVNKRNWPL